MKRSIASQLLASVLINAIYAMENYPVMLVNTLLAPFSILIIIILVTHGGLIKVGIEGALLMTTITAGIGLQGDLSHLKNDMKMQDMVVSSPTTSLIYVTGMGLSELIFAAPVLALLTILAAIYVQPTTAQVLIMIAVMSITFVFSIVLGFLFSTMTSDVIQSWGFSGIVSIVLSTLPPVYYPISYIPQPLQLLAYLSPTTYAAEIVQNAIGFISLSPLNLAADWIVLIAICIGLIIIAYKKAQWRES